MSHESVTVGTGEAITPDMADASKENVDKNVVADQELGPPKQHEGCADRVAGDTRASGNEDADASAPADTSTSQGKRACSSASSVSNDATDTTAQRQPQGEEDGGSGALVEAASLPEGTQLTGEVTSVRESFGFVRCQGVSDEVFFHVSALKRLPEEPAQSPTLQRIKALSDHVKAGDEVELKLGRNKKQSDRTIGIEVVVTKRAEEAPAAPPVPMRGTVRKKAAGPRTHKVDDGMIAYTDPEGNECLAPYGNYSVSDSKGRTLEEGTPVAFKLLVLKRKPGGQDVTRAVQVRRERAEGEGGIGSTGPQGALPPIVEEGAQRELGTVTVRKPQFGFIKCCERAGDLFFHISAVSGLASPEDLKVGDDVEFTIGKDPHSKKSIALRVVRVPKGTAVFEVVSEKTYSGVVLERAAVGKNYSKVSSGVIEYEDDKATQKIIFGVADLQDSRASPAPGDPVTFRIATNLRAARAAAAAGSAAAQHAGRRATLIAAVRYSGRVVALKDRFGFIRRSKAHQVAAADKVERWGKMHLTVVPGDESSSAETVVSPKLLAAAAEHDHKEGSSGSSGAEEGKEEGEGAKKEEGEKKDKKEKKAKAVDVFFHLSEVEDGVQLHISDEVEFVLYENPKTKEINARCIRRTKEAFIPGNGAAAPHASGGSANAQQAAQQAPAAEPAPPVERKRLVLTPTTALSGPKGGQTMYVPKCPDGSKGFTLGRGRPLGHPPARTSPAPTAGFPSPPQHASSSGAFVPHQPPPPHQRQYQHQHQHHRNQHHQQQYSHHVHAHPPNHQSYTLSYVSPFGRNNVQAVATHPSHPSYGASPHAPSPTSARLPPLSPRPSFPYNGMEPGATVLMSVVTDSRGRPNLMRVTSSGKLDANAPVFIPRSMSVASIATEASFVTCGSEDLSRSP